MDKDPFASRFSHFHLPVCAALAVAAMLSGCSFSEPEYARLLANARTECRGSEIAGVWVDRQEAPAPMAGQHWLSTMLLRSDGTGTWRRMFENPDAQAMDAHTLVWNLTYNYAGGGLWRIDGYDLPVTARLAGAQLLMEIGQAGFQARRVWTRARSDTAVNYERAQR
jgi:hypothetical protein